MTRRLAYAPTPDDIRLAGLLIAVRRKREQLAAAEADRFELEIALTQFALEIKRRVGDMRDEIRTHRAHLEALRRRVEHLKADPDASPAEAERRFRPEDEAGAPPIPSNGWTTRPGAAADDGLPRPFAARDRTPELVETYRLLARRHHPDLATTPEERQRRTELMLRINIAFRDRNLAALQAILYEVHHDAPLAGADITRQRLQWARTELRRLDADYRAVMSRLTTLKGSETYALWRSEQEGDRALDDLERRTRERLQRERSRVEEARSQYQRMAARREVLLRRSMARAHGAMAQASD